MYTIFIYIYILPNREMIKKNLQSKRKFTVFGLRWARDTIFKVRTSFLMKKIEFIEIQNGFFALPGSNSI